MAVNSIKDLSGLEKASILLIALGTSAAAQVFKHLSEPEIEKLAAQIIKMRDIDKSVIEEVVKEFEQVCATNTNASGGKEFAAQVLEQVVGGEKANELLEKAGSPSYGRPFESLWAMDAKKISSALADEHPQIVALVLTNLPAEKAASVLSDLPDHIQAETARRICTMDDIDPEVARAVEEGLHAKLSITSNRIAVSGGPQTLVEILNNATRSTERNILDFLAEQDPATHEQVRGMMFVFEDLPKLEDRTIQTVLREVDQENLRLALKGADEEIKALVYRNMSERAAEMLKEDLELLANVRSQDVEAAQQKIVGAVRRLLATGEAVLKESSDKPDQQEQTRPDEGGGDQSVGESDQEQLAA